MQSQQQQQHQQQQQYYHQHQQLPQQYQYVAGRDGSYYCYEAEAEGYAGDYSESEGMSEIGAYTGTRWLRIPQDNKLVATAHDVAVTELYRRKPTQEVPYGQEMYHPVTHHAEYYYDPSMIATAPRRSAPTRVVRRRMADLDAVQRSLQDYYAEEYQTGDLYDHPGIYRSTPQLQQVMRQARKEQAAHPQQAPQMIRPGRHVKPPTVRTPRYYRPVRPSGSRLYKRPSTLCLPISMQEDPGLKRSRLKTASIPVQEQLQQPAEVLKSKSKLVSRKPSLANRSKHLVASYPNRGDHADDVTNMTSSEMDAVLTTYEKSFLKKCREVPKTVSAKTSKSRISPTLQGLKPRVPSSIKAQQVEQERLRKAQEAQQDNGPERDSPRSESQIEKDKGPVEHVEVEEITTDMLDNLLTDLMKSGCMLSENKPENLEEKPNGLPSVASIDKSKDSSKEKSSKSSVKLSSKAQINDNEEQIPKSFNYEEMSQRRKANSATKVEDKQSKHSSSRIQNPGRSAFEDTNSAMELRWTKSYIISLIDRALSRELGTIPEDHTVRSHPYLDISNALTACPPKVTASGSNPCPTDSSTNSATGSHNNSNKTDNDLYLHALTEYLTSITVGKDHNCSYMKDFDESTFVKQLKQLRWGHLKHIQHEVRRLEDLERFLDSCGSGSTYH